MEIIDNISSNKLRGAFYTPDALAVFILKWGVTKQDLDILEPSCGDGVFLKLLKEKKYKYNSITAIELENIELEKAQNYKLNKASYINDDFHHYCNTTDEKYDLIVGNPPYIRYQYFKEEQQVEAGKIFDRINLKYSKLTNAWVSFVIGSSLLLKEKGKIAFVLPAELLQVSYAKQLREFLSTFYNKINIISFEKLVFPDIQQEVIILLCEKDNSYDHFIDHIEVQDSSCLEHIDLNTISNSRKSIDLRANKWTYYFLDQIEIDFLNKLKRGDKLSPIKKYAKNEVGITTGKNEFFTVPKGVVSEYNLGMYAKPLMGRSVQLNGLEFNQEDWIKNVELGARAYMLIFPEKKELQKQNLDAYNYVKYGELQKFHEGYKCKIRLPEWQIVPSLKVSELFFTRQIHLHPKIVVNGINAYTTDTVHRVYLKEKIDPKTFAVSFYNSISFAFSEIVGRSYGGGVLELMPNEVEEILIPYHFDNAKLFETVDKMMREKKNIDDIIKITDKLILKDIFNFTEEEISLANNIWKKLSSRRINRKNR